MLKLKPGTLVALRTHVKGGVRYEKVDLGTRIAEDGSEHARWETTRHVADPEELRTADNARMRAVYAIEAVCAKTAWGYICPEAEEEALRGAIKKAHEIAAEHNASSKHTQVRLNLMLAQVASSDYEAISAVRQEVADLLEAAEQSALQGDVKALRAQALQAKELVKLIDEGDHAEKVGGVVTGLRRIANDVNRLVNKAGKDIEEVLTEEHLKPIADARFAFGETRREVA